MGNCLSSSSSSRDIKVLLERVLSEQIGIKSELGNIKSELGNIKSKLGNIKSKLGNLERAALLKEKNPWFEMAETDRSRAKGLREQVMNRLEKLKCPFQCMLTDCCDTQRLKVAHILPDSTNSSILKDLKLPSEFRNDINAPRWNFMVLRNDIEEAFDSLKILFIPISILQPDDFYLRIIDKTNLDPLFLDLEGLKLNVPKGVSLSKRALSYQAYMAYIQATYKDPSVDIDVPLEFSTEFDGRDAIRDRFAGFITSSIHDESLEIDQNE